MRRHQDLADALIDGGRIDAAQAMRQHIADGMVHTLDVLQPYLKARKAHSGTFFRSDRRRQLLGMVLPPAKPDHRPQRD